MEFVALGILVVFNICVNLISFTIIFKNQKFISDEIDELKKELDSKN